AAFVRVNQVGYASAATKRAYLLASVPESGATFAVSNGSTTVFTGPVGSDLGRWSARFPHVYALDFDAVARAGTYTISVQGPAPAGSLAFPIGAAPSIDADPIANALSFYRNERDGIASPASPLPTEAGHRRDRAAMTFATPRYDGDSGEYRA